MNADSSVVMDMLLDFTLNPQHAAIGVRPECTPTSIPTYPTLSVSFHLFVNFSMTRTVIIIL
jgi:hypothetical protein